MKFRQTIRQDPDVNLTPLIDVVFLLLIFFMVSTTFKHEAEITLDLPQSTATKQQEEKAIQITIDAQGRFFINRQQVVNKKLETLTEALRKVIGNTKSPALTINADARTPHQYVVTAMDAARSLGINRLSMATRKRTPAQ